MIYSQPNTTLTNANLNALGSQYATLGGHDTNLLIQKITEKIIFDASPQQFYDLTLLNQKPAEQADSDEVFYQEMGHQREPLTSTGIVVSVTSPATQNIPISSLSNISLDTMIVYPTNEKGNVVAINTAASEITVRPMTGMTLPAVAVGDIFANHSPIEADAAAGFSQYFRAKTIERFNYVQILSKAMKFGRMEMHKYMRAGVTSNYLAMNKQQMYLQQRTDLSNCFWNGERGEITVAGGEKAKSMGGLYPLMLAAGSPNTICTSATLQDAFEDMILSSEYGEYGQTRFAFMPNRIHLMLSKIYKDAKIRYNPQGDFAVEQEMHNIGIGSSKIVLVSYNRWTDASSFPPDWANRIIIVDMHNITRQQVWGETTGETGDRRQGFTQNFKEIFIDMTISLKFHNPLACAYLDVSS